MIGRFAWRTCIAVRAYPRCEMNLTRGWGLEPRAPRADGQDGACDVTSTMVGPAPGETRSCPAISA
jgi:hypothetical protein